MVRFYCFFGFFFKSLSSTLFISIKIGYVVVRRSVIEIGGFMIGVVCVFFCIIFTSAKTITISIIVRLCYIDMSLHR